MYLGDFSRFTKEKTLEHSEQREISIYKDKETNVECFVQSFPINSYASNEFNRYFKILHQLRDIEFNNMQKLMFFLHDNDNFYIGSKFDQLNPIDIKKYDDKTIANLIFTVTKQLYYLHQANISHQNIKLSSIYQNSSNDFVIIPPQPISLYDIQKGDEYLPFFDKPPLSNDIFLLGLLIIECIAGVSYSDILDRIWSFKEVTNEKSPILELAIKCLDWDLEERPTIEKIYNTFITEGIQIHEKTYKFTAEEKVTIPKQITDEEYLNIVKSDADKGDIIALLIYGTHLIKKASTPEEKQLGIDYMEKCPLPAAINNLSNAYQKENPQKSYECLKKASDMNFPVAIRSLYLHYIKKSKDESLITNTIPKLTELGYKGYIPALFTISDRVRLCDPPEAYKMMLFCAHHGYANSIHYVGLFHEYGFGAEKDSEMSNRYWKIGLKLRYGPCTNNLGTHCPDPVQACKYWILGSELGSGEAAYNLAIHYLTGNGIEKDPVKAFHYMKLAASRNQIFSMFDYAIMVRDGVGCEKDEKLSEELCRQAAAARHTREMKKKLLQEEAMKHNVVLPKYFDYF
ncbi:hypothetical protein TVAG_104550 [Trichomonas vaginalis G3]|uniref:Protein kinase domain-containing protein n=1 Tax=Trichomonas vaginalis (strain ATCC PRA-98 / G3) TaxID=412133 RepID=A2F6A3_TRIV3|nr:SEL-1-like protein family [Trichomonas vaginalis G3]EAX99574.1 hypothetical protein TVAG_104550 [Trichomonas vaginalis G3]KAI5490960.1 SEL-1-like protein family [Trichomonas vaginalis G3]|eukprot:XP_001312504.1 hypothetical protein [Trichomonas vaginalis G3]